MLDGATDPAHGFVRRSTRSGQRRLVATDARNAPSLRHWTTSKTANSAFTQNWLTEQDKLNGPALIIEVQVQPKQGGPRASATCKSDAAKLSLKIECQPTQTSGLKQAEVQFGVVAERQSAWHTEQS